MSVSDGIQSALPAEARPAARRIGLTRRAGAWLLDFAIAALIGALATAPLDGSGRTTDMLGFGTLLAVWYVYLVVAESVWHTTPGERILGLRVLRADSRPSTVATALRRNATKALLSPQAALLAATLVAPHGKESDAVFGIALLTLIGLSCTAAFLIRSSGRSVGDRLAGTAVVRRLRGDEQTAVAFPHGEADVEVDGSAVRRLAARLDSAPWGLRDVLLASAIALGPLVVLSLISTGGQPRPPSVRLATVVLVVTVVQDAWFTAWAWRYSLRRYHLRPEAWGFRRPPLSILWLVPLGLLINLVVEAVQGAFVPSPLQAVSDVFPHTFVGALLLVSATCAIAPVLEEVFYRGFLFRGLMRSCGPLWAAILSAAVFAALHWEPLSFVPLFVGGLLLAWLYYRTKSLWTSIALHAAINTMATIAWLLR